jgi:hypothetical protein
MGEAGAIVLVLPGLRNGQSLDQAAVTSDAPRDVAIAANPPCRQRVRIQTPLTGALDRELPGWPGNSGRQWRVRTDHVNRNEGIT